MAEPERQTARSVLAYERGARQARRLVMFSVLIGLLALALGGGAVWWARQDLKTTTAQKDAIAIEAGKLKKSADAERTRIETLTSLNKRLIQLGSIVAALQPDDAAGASAALKEVDDLIALTASEESLAPVALTLREIRIGVLVSTNDFRAAIEEQRALNAAAPPSAGRILDLAILECRADDPEGARETLRIGLSPEDAALLTGDDRLINACGDSLGALAPQLTGEAPLTPAETSSPGDTSDDITNGDTPATKDTAAQDAAAKITKIFLHVRTEGQRANAARIAESICKAGYQMPGIQVVPEPRFYPSSARVIFYYSDQTDAAVTIARKVENMAADLSLSGYDKAFDARLYRAEGLPEDRVEIWFDEFAPETADTVEKRFKCNP